MSLVVTATVLNLRAGPGQSNPIITKIIKGTTFEEIGRSADGRWVQGTVSLVDGKVTGWASADYLESEAPAPLLDVPWLNFAQQEIGVQEFAGAADNPRIVEYHSMTTLHASDDEVAWCSSFANWCMTKSGKEGTKLANARSWLQWGSPLSQPRAGCVTVFKRGSNPVQGHVAFFLRDRGATLEVLGGNQSNKVCVAHYRAADVIGYRWPE